MKLKKYVKTAVLSSIFAISLSITSVQASMVKDKQTTIGTYDIDGRWASTIGNYIYAEDDNLVKIDELVYDKNKKRKVLISRYDKKGKKISEKKLDYQGEKFGGFYKGKENNYIIFGNNNSKNSDKKEVIRIVKYNKNFKELGKLSVKGAYTANPFDAGSLRCAEIGQTVLVHTSRLRYDGHQSQLTIAFDEDSMTLLNADDLGEFQRNHVSHDFNQFVMADGKEFITVDHGDAGPRSILVSWLKAEKGEKDENGNSLNDENWENDYEDNYENDYGNGYGNDYEDNYGNDYGNGYEDDYEDDDYNWSDDWNDDGQRSEDELFSVLKSKEVLKIPGEEGANQTGVSIGSAANMKNTVLVGVNQIDYSKAKSFDSYAIKGKDVNKRNVALYSLNKDTLKVTKNRYTDYTKDKDTTYTAPKMVKLDDERAMLIWNKLNLKSYKSVLQYLIVDEKGKKKSKIKTMKDMVIADEVPIIYKNKVVWSQYKAGKLVINSIPLK